MDLLRRLVNLSIATACLTVALACGLGPPPTAPTPPQPLLSVDRALAFGDVEVGQTKDVTITIRNLTRAALTVTARAPQALSNVITIVSGVGAVEAGGTLPITFRFTPTTSGLISGSIDLVADGVPHSLAMTGTGISSAPVTVVGVVSDANTHLALGSVRVTALDGRRASVASTTTDGNGFYSFVVPSGTALAIEYSRAGYAPYAVTESFVALSRRDITLVPEASPAAFRFVTFDFTGTPQSFTVPAGVSQITIDAFGAQGGGGCCNAGLASRSAGGSGGRIVATVAVTAGDLLTILVGGAGQDGASGIAGGYNGGGRGGVSFFQLAPNGGGGGGASAVTRAGTAMVIAGGGGGGGTFNGVAGGAGGAGGGTTAAIGESARFNSRSPSGGGGGTQSNGGAGGGGAEFVSGGSGSLLQGGNGASDYSGGGGGGGGYFGGGGGGAGSAPAGGGGGGSSFAMPGATNISHAQGVRAGNGQIVITW